MTDPLVLDPYACPSCGTRLQWVVTFDPEDTDEEKPRSRLSVIEFETSERHVCQKKTVRRRRLPPEPVDPMKVAMAGLEAAQKETSAVLKAHLGEMLTIADRATEALVASDSILAHLRGRQLPPEPQQRSRTGGMHL